MSAFPDSSMNRPSPSPAVEQRRKATKQKKKRPTAKQLGGEEMVQAAVIPYDEMDVDSEPSVTVEMADTAFQLPDLSSLLVDETMLTCNLCGDVGEVLTCKTLRGGNECGATVCLQTVRGAAGCIDRTTLIDGTTFKCPNCLNHARERMPYFVTGWPVSPSTTTVRMYPLGFLRLLHGSPTYLASSIVESVLDEAYYPFPQHLRKFTVHMKKAAARPKEHTGMVDWLGGFTHSGFLLLVDSHSCGTTGNISHMGPSTARLSSSLEDVITSYLGKPNLETLRNAEVSGCVLLACGPAFYQSVHVNALLEYFPLHGSTTGMTTPTTRYPFQFLLGFSGSGIVPINVVLSLTKFVMNVYVSRLSPWDALVKSFGRDPDALRHSPVILLWKESDRNHHRTLTYSTASHHVWGVNWRCKFAGTEECSSRPGDLRCSTDNKHGEHDKASFHCAACGWQSAKISRPDDIQPIPGHQHVYWHKYPPPPLMMSAIHVDKPAPKAPPPQAQRDGKRQRTEQFGNGEGSMRRF